MRHSYLKFGRSSVPLEEKFNFNPFEFEAKSYLNHSLQSDVKFNRSSKTYLNDKNLINGQEIALIFLFRAENFELCIVKV